jgi:hypothetical protein
VRLLRSVRRVVGVVHPHGPEQLQPVAVAVVGHQPQRVRSLGEQVGDDVHAVGTEASAVAEDITHLGLVQEHPEGPRGAVEDGVHLRAQQRRGAQGEERFLGGVALQQVVVAIVVEDDPPGAVRRLGALLAVLREGGGVVGGLRQGGSSK